MLVTKPMDIYRRKCLLLDKREQIGWVRDAIFHFFHHYQIDDMVDDPVALPDHVENLDDIRLEKTHSWVLSEIGINKLIWFIRPKVFVEADEKAAIDWMITKNHLKSFSELSYEQLGSIESAIKIPRLHKVRIYCNIFLGDYIKGQPSVMNFIEKHMVNSEPNRISCILRMRKSLYEKGSLTPDVDNPDSIYKLYIDTFSPEFLRSGNSKELFEIMLNKGISIFRAEEAVKRAVAPPESEWRILPRIDTIGEFTFEIKRKDAIDNLFVGEINDCCMQIGHQAESCLYDIISNPMSSVLVISKDGVPVAHSWLRLGRSGTLYLDNIERTIPIVGNTEIVKAIKSWAEMMTEVIGMKPVHIGLKFSDISLVGNFETGLMTDTKYAMEFGETDVYTDLKDANLWIFLPQDPTDPEGDTVSKLARQIERGFMFQNHIQVPETIHL